MFSTIGLFSVLGIILNLNIITISRKSYIRDLTDQNLISFPLNHF
jgi:hypothetical protein